MVDEGRSGGTYGSYGGDSKPWEDRGGMAAGTILATAIAAGVVAYLLRRSREPEPPASRVASFARDFAGRDSVGAGRDFVLEKLVPEMKPALLAILGEIEDVVDQGFRRAERAIKKL
jgi:hypothetical protein